MSRPLAWLASASQGSLPPSQAGGPGAERDADGREAKLFPPSWAPWTGLKYPPHPASSSTPRRPAGGNSLARLRLLSGRRPVGASQLVQTSNLAPEADQTKTIIVSKNSVPRGTLADIMSPDLISSHPITLASYHMLSSAVPYHHISPLRRRHLSHLLVIFSFSALRECSFWAPPEACLGRCSKGSPKVFCPRGLWAVLLRGCRPLVFGSSSKTSVPRRQQKGREARA